MPLPSVEPMPPVSRLDRFTVPRRGAGRIVLRGIGEDRELAVEGELGHGRSFMFTADATAQVTTVAHVTKDMIDGRSNDRRAAVRSIAA